MSTPRKLLRSALGRHHTALDDIPLHKFEFKAHNHCWSAEYEATALHYGKMSDDQNMSREVWVHLTKSDGRAGAPEIHYIGINPIDGSPVQFKAKDVAERAQIRHEFGLISGRSQELPPFLRACITLKCSTITSVNFSESFLKFLRRACRRYEDANGDAASSHTPGSQKVANGYESSPEVPLVLESSTMKYLRQQRSLKQSEQRGRHDPRFNASQLQSSPTPAFRASQAQAQGQLRSTAYGDRHLNMQQTPDSGRVTPLPSSWRPNAMAGNFEASDNNISGAPIAPRAMMRTWSKELNNETARHFSNNHDVRMKREEAIEAVNPVSMPPPATPTRAQTLQKIDEPGGSHMADRSSSSDAVDMLHALNKQIETVQTEIDRYKQSITEANTVWMQRRENKRKEIDEDLCQRHKEQHIALKEEQARQEAELRAHQRQEYLELKGQYTKMKEDQQLDVAALQQQAEKKRLELRALQQSFEEQRQILAKDPNKLIDALLAQGGTSTKRKREDSAGGGRDSHDHDVTMSG